MSCVQLTCTSIQYWGEQLFWGLAWDKQGSTCLGFGAYIKAVWETSGPNASVFMTVSANQRRAQTDHARSGARCPEHCKYCCSQQRKLELGEKLGTWDWEDLTLEALEEKTEQMPGLCVAAQECEAGGVYTRV